MARERNKIAEYSFCLAKHSLFPCLIPMHIPVLLSFTLVALSCRISLLHTLLVHFSILSVFFHNILCSIDSVSFGFCCTTKNEISIEHTYWAPIAAFLEYHEYNDTIKHVFPSLSENTLHFSWFRLRTIFDWFIRFLFRKLVVVICVCVCRQAT